MLESFKGIRVNMIQLISIQSPKKREKQEHFCERHEHVTSPLRHTEAWLEAWLKALLVFLHGVAYSSKVTAEKPVFPWELVGTHFNST